MEVDELIEVEDSPYVLEEEPAQSSSWYMFNPFTYLLEFLAEYGWTLVFVSTIGFLVFKWLSKNTNLFKWSDPDAELKKDPDRALARMEAVQRARELQQRALEEASLRAAEQQKEREERRRAEALERLQKYGAGSGQRLGSHGDDYLPLSAGASASTYRPPKKSKCSGGGCGR